MGAGRVVSFTAVDDSIGSTVEGNFTNAATIMSFHEDGSIMAKVVYMEGTQKLVLNFELDVKALIPAPEDQNMDKEEKLFESWYAAGGGGSSAATRPSSIFETFTERVFGS